ncbi:MULTISPECIES: hypothetical protein [unclassified Legionella]|uniref:hypothetical protein n=1 Tax=unclassified Legionella TaxID=2622702 RepID=UPI0010542EB2|nr:MULTISPECIES: hypothetical protein [unclassified Legionella]MDI9818403.1 hypothetical protein [Legionella sp. PL877]
MLQKKNVIRAIKKTQYDLKYPPQYIEESIWPEEVMKVALAQKASHRLKKKIPFNYMVTEFKSHEDSTDYYLKENKELSGFIQFLKDNHHKLPEGLRFQLAVLINGHWTCVDNLITSKGISTFNLDAVMGDKARIFFLVYNNHLQHHKILRSGYTYYVSVPSEGPLAGTPKEKVANMIQTDFVSCGIFVVDHLSFLSRTNVFQHLKKNLGESDYVTLGRADIPQSLSSIFRLSQSKRLFANLGSKQMKQPVTRKEKTLAEAKNSLYVNAKNKGNRILTNALTYVQDSDEDVYQKIFSHKLQDQLSAYVQNYSKPVNDLIAFIYNSLPECLYLSDEESIKLMEQLHQVILLPNCNDTQKILKLVDIAVPVLEKSNNAASYRSIAGILSYTVLHIDDNQQLFDFYCNIVNSSFYKGLNTNTNSFFNTPTRFTPALISHIEKAIKTQLLYNAAIDLSKEQNNQLNFISNSPECLGFLKKPRTFDTTETKSSQVFHRLTDLQNKKIDGSLESVMQTLEQRRNEVLNEFHFGITPASDIPHSLS